MRSRLPAAPARVRVRGLAALAVVGLVGACTSAQAPYWPIIPRDLPPPRLVTGDANGSTVDVVRTQWLIVRLPADLPGNRWSFELGKDRVLYPSGDTPRDAPVPAGAAPAVEFVFRAEGTGTTSMRFLYRDPDQPQATPARTLAFDVVAR